MTFQSWVAELIEVRFGTATALAAKIGMKLSPFTRGVALGRLNLVNLLKLAKVADEHPSKVLRLAGKGPEADLIEELYGSAHETFTASERAMIAHWRELSLGAQTGLSMFVRRARDPKDEPEDAATEKRSTKRRLITFEEERPPVLGADAPKSDTAKPVSTRSTTKQKKVDGRSLAALVISDVHHGHPDPVPPTSTPDARDTLGRRLIKAGSEILAAGARARATKPRRPLPETRPAKPAPRKRRTGNR